MLADGDGLPAGLREVSETGLGSTRDFDELRLRLTKEQEGEQPDRLPAHCGQLAKKALSSGHSLNAGGILQTNRKEDQCEYSNWTERGGADNLNLLEELLQVGLDAF